MSQKEQKRKKSKSKDDTKSRDSSSKSKEKKKKEKKRKSESKSPRQKSKITSLSKQENNNNQQQQLGFQTSYVQDKQVVQEYEVVQQNEQIPFFQQEKKCVHHDLSLQLFCESCEEPICRQCTILGPHNSQLHRINRVEEAYRSRVARLSETIRNNLLIKRDQLLAQIHRIEYRIEEIRYVKSIIEKDAKADYGGIIERLKSGEGIKIAVLQHEMSELQKDLDKINDIGHTFNEFTKDTSDPIGFLLKSRNLYENIEFLVAKPFKINIDIFPYDLPRELTEMRLQLQKVNAQKQLIDYKNEAIWKMIEQKKAMEDQIKLQMEETANAELQEWSKLTQQYSCELKNYYLVCYYCNTQLQDTSINKKCSQNVKVLESDFKGYTEQHPDSKFNGNQRHFFGKPLKDYIEFIHDQQNQERQIASGNNKLKIFIEVDLSRIQKICQEKKINLQEIFEKHDKQKNGLINSITFKYLLSDRVGITEQDADRLFQFFDQHNKKQIGYKNFLQIMNNPSLLDQNTMQNQ